MIGMKSIVKTAVVVSATAALFGCDNSEQQAAEGALPRQQTLYLSGQQWGAPATFNPLAESWMAAWPVGGRFNLVYEPLVTYNTLNGQVESLLGTLSRNIATQGVGPSGPAPFSYAERSVPLPFAPLAGRACSAGEGRGSSRTQALHNSICKRAATRLVGLC